MSTALTAPTEEYAKAEELRYTLLQAADRV
jgi:hypothetical protein